MRIFSILCTAPLRKSLLRKSLTFQVLHQQLKWFNDLSHSQQTLNFSGEPSRQATPSCMIITMSSVKVWSNSHRHRGRMPGMIQDGAVLIYVSMWTHAVDRINWYSTPSERISRFFPLDHPIGPLESGPIGWLLREDRCAQVSSTWWNWWQSACGTKLSNTELLGQAGPQASGARQHWSGNEGPIKPNLGL